MANIDVIRKNTEKYTGKQPRDAILANKFKDFYENMWLRDEMYAPSDFIGKFGINRHLARYYLMDMLRERKVFRVKYSNKTFYGIYNLKVIDKFKEFTWMGVEVKYVKPKEPGSNQSVPVRTQSEIDLLKAI